MEEIEEVVGDKDTLDADDVDKLVYMNQVCVPSQYTVPGTVNVIFRSVSISHRIFIFGVVLYKTDWLKLVDFVIKLHL